MPYNFHYSAFIFKFLKFVLLNNLSFNFFNCDNGMLPASSIHNTVSTFWQFFIIRQLIKRYLVILFKGPGIVRNKIVFLLLLLYQSLFELSFYILWVGARLLQFYDHLALFWVKHSERCFFFLIESLAFLGVIFLVFLFLRPFKYEFLS